MKTRILAMNQHPRNGYRHNIMATSTTVLNEHYIFPLLGADNLLDGILREYVDLSLTVKHKEKKIEINSSIL